jgi:hypothetical protein
MSDWVNFLLIQTLYVNNFFIVLIFGSLEIYIEIIRIMIVTSLK